MNFFTLVAFLIAGSCTLNSVKAAGPAKIYNGQSSQNASQFYYMAQLKLGIQHKCGGALISEQHVLTSVNCVDEMVKNRKNSEKITVVLNSRFFNSYKGDVYDVIDIRTYPRFLKGPENSEHDIAIVYLKDKVVTHEDTNSPRPVKLPTEDIAWGDVATVTGWGLTQRGVHPPVLQFTEMTVFNKYSCQSYINSTRTHNITLYDSEFCAFVNMNRDHGTCNGDLGAPLVTDEGYLIGLLSSEIGECGSGGLELFVNVYRYIDFIHQLMAMKPTKPDDKSNKLSFGKIYTYSPFVTNKK